MPPALSACFLAGPVLAAAMLAHGAAPALGGEHGGSDKPRLELTLEDAVLLVLRNNRRLINAHLTRVTDRFTLRVAENKFRPHVTVGPFLERTLPHSSSGVGRAGVSSGVRMLTPTGGEVSLALRGGGANGPHRYFSDLRLEFAQPLLRGAGRTVNTASVGMARLAERSNILSLKQAVIDVVSSVAQSYRSYIQAERRVGIRAKSLERARELLAVNELLVRTGRMAARDIVQTQADIAGRELALVAAESALDAARLNLLDILDIDSRTRVRLTDPLDAEPVHGGGPQQGVEEALRQRPDYLKAVLAVRSAESAVAVAGNERLWDLSVALSATVSDTGGSPGRAVGNPDYAVGLNLAVPLGPAAVDPRERAWTEAVTALRKARNDLSELRQKIGIEVSNAVRELEISARQVALARAARQLVERKADVEREKLRLGLSSNFQLVAFEDDLVAAQNRELDAVIAWLNAGTALDRTLGVTLDRRGIDFERLEREGER